MKDDLSFLNFLFENNLYTGYVIAKTRKVIKIEIYFPY